MILTPREFSFKKMKNQEEKEEKQADFIREGHEAPQIARFFFFFFFDFERKQINETSQVQNLS